MFQELKINGTALPRPDGNLEFVSEKVKTEYETEAGTTQVSVRRESKLNISGAWTLTGSWVALFRMWASMDSVTVAAFFPEKDSMSDHECQFTITSEKHVRNAREQLHTDGLYQLTVKMEEL
ncbi:MAG: head-tail adaptor protein [Oscillospiraceae bacterium]|nr:head-tail adaptor protein [Oscillospiraceae bacterium]